MFSSNKNKIDSLSYQCKDCDKEDSKKWHEKHPFYDAIQHRIWSDKHPFYSAINNRERRNKLLLQGLCIECGKRLLSINSTKCNVCIKYQSNYQRWYRSNNKGLF